MTKLTFFAAGTKKPGKPGVSFSALDRPRKCAFKGPPVDNFDARAPRPQDFPQLHRFRPLWKTAPSSFLRSIRTLSRARQSPSLYTAPWPARAARAPAIGLVSPYFAPIGEPALVLTDVNASFMPLAGTAVQGLDAQASSAYRGFSKDTR